MRGARRRPPPFHGRDVWYDVRSAASTGHWIPAAGDALKAMLIRLRDAGVPADQIRVISPFRLVAGNAATVYQSVFPEVSNDDRKQWVGTVHTMQGKEADVVILILGGDPDCPGHAASPPRSRIYSTSRSAVPSAASTSSATWTPGARSRTSMSWPPASQPGARTDRDITSSSAVRARSYCPARGARRGAGPRYHRSPLQAARGQAVLTAPPSMR